MIKILAICGSPVKKGNVEAVVEEAFADCKNDNEVDFEIISLADMEFSGCIHCNWCAKKQTDDKYCSQDDDMTGLYPKIANADAVMLACPVHFGRLSGLLADMIDRMRAFVHGSVHRGRLRNKVGGSLAVAFFRGGGLEGTLASMNSMFNIFQMPVATASMTYQQGAGIVTSVNGTGKVTKGVRHMALEDAYGTESAKLVVNRMIELAKIMKAGQAALGM